MKAKTGTCFPTVFHTVFIKGTVVAETNFKVPHFSFWVSAGGCMRVWTDITRSHYLFIKVHINRYTGSSFAVVRKCLHGYWSQDLVFELKVRNLFSQIWEQNKGGVCFQVDGVLPVKWSKFGGGWVKSKKHCQKLRKTSFFRSQRFQSHQILPPVKI